MTSNAPTSDWQPIWAQQSFATGTTWATTTNPQTYTIKAVGSGNSAFGVMSAKKVVKDGKTSFWWGYSSQVNFATVMTTGQYLVSWMQIQGNDVTNPKSYLNFYCTFIKGATTNTLGSNADCGSADISTTPAVPTGATFVGNISPYASVSKCPNAATQSTWYQSQVYQDATTTTNAYHQCVNYRSSQDTATYVAANGVGSTITFKAGYTIFATSTGAIVDKQAMTTVQTYTVTDVSGALTLAVSLGLTATSIASYMF